MLNCAPRYGPALDYYMSIEVRDKANEVAKEVLDNFEEEEVWCQCRGAIRHESKLCARTHT